MLERCRKSIELHITVSGENDAALEDEMDQFRLKFVKIRTIKREGDTVFHYEVSGRGKEVDNFLGTLYRNKAIKSFEY